MGHNKSWPEKVYSLNLRTGSEGSKYGLTQCQILSRKGGSREIDPAYTQLSAAVNTSS
jgi:hypothetical protein